MFDKLIFENSAIFSSEISRKALLLKIIIDKSQIKNNAKENFSLDPTTISAPLKSKDATVSVQPIPNSHGLYEFAYEICVHPAKTVFSPDKEPTTFNGFL